MGFRLLTNVLSLGSPSDLLPPRPLPLSSSLRPSVPPFTGELFKEQAPDLQETAKVPKSLQKAK